MTKEKFKECINAILELEKWCDDLYALDLDITNSKYFNYGVLADNLWLEAFGEEGMDWINWWLYERDRNIPTSEQCWNKNEVGINIDTIEQLYDFITKHK